MKYFSVAAVLSFITVMISCNQPKQSTGNGSNNQPGVEALFQNEWEPTEIDGQPVPSAAKAILQFSKAEPNRVSGNTGCNRMTGTFELSNNSSIQFSPLATTKMACMDESANKLENGLLNALSKATNWKIEGNTLLLTNDEKILASFKSQKPATAEERQLNGTWELNYISGPKITFNGLFPDKKPTIIFDFPNESANGNGGCNGYSTKVKVEGNKISFGDALSTMMACEGDGEPIYFKTLKTITSFEIKDNTLTMIMGDIAVMRFTRK